MPDSPFLFADTASARQLTTDLAMKLKDEKVAIVGVGGTGSYVLDFVANILRCFIRSGCPLLMRYLRFR